MLRTVPPITGPYLTDHGLLSIYGRCPFFKFLHRLTNDPTSFVRATPNVIIPTYVPTPTIVKPTVTVTGTYPPPPAWAAPSTLTNFILAFVLLGAIGIGFLAVALRLAAYINNDDGLVIIEDSLSVDTPSPLARFKNYIHAMSLTIQRQAIKINHCGFVIKHLSELLRKSQHELKQINHTLESLRADHSVELARLKDAQDAKNADYDATVAQLMQTVKDLEAKLADAHHEQAVNDAVHERDLARLNEEIADLESELDTQRADHLKTSLSLADAYTQESTRADEATAKARYAESNAAAVTQELEVVKGDLATRTEELALANEYLTKTGDSENDLRWHLTGARELIEDLKAQLSALSTPRSAPSEPFIAVAEPSTPSQLSTPDMTDSECSTFDDASNRTSPTSDVFPVEITPISVETPQHAKRSHSAATARPRGLFQAAFKQAGLISQTPSESL